MARSKVISSKKEIVNAAFDIVNSEGVNALSSRRLANYMKVSNMTLYNYVENIDEIKKEIILEGFRKLYSKAYQSLKEAKKQKPDLDIKKSCQIIAGDIFDFGCQYKNIYQLMFLNSEAKFRNDAELKPFYNYFIQLLPKKDASSEIKKALNMLDFIASQMIMDKITGIHNYSKKEFDEYMNQYTEKMFI